MLNVDFFLDLITQHNHIHIIIFKKNPSVAEDFLMGENITINCHLWHYVANFHLWEMPM